MNNKEELKKAVIESCINGTMTIKVAASRLGFSERYVKKKYKMQEGKIMHFYTFIFLIKH